MKNIYSIKKNPEEIKIRILNSQNNKTIKKRLHLISNFYLSVNKDLYKKLADQ